MNKNRDTQLEAVVAALCERLLGGKKEAQRDVAALGLKAAAGELAPERAGVLVGAAVPRLLGGLKAEVRVGEVGGGVLFLGVVLACMGCVGGVGGERGCMHAARCACPSSHTRSLSSTPMPGPRRGGLLPGLAR